MQENVKNTDQLLQLAQQYLNKYSQEEQQRLVNICFENFKPSLFSKYIDLSIFILLIGNEQQQQIVCNAITSDLILKDIQKHKFSASILPGVLSLTVQGLENILMTLLDELENYDISEDNSGLDFLLNNILMFACSTSEYNQIISQKFEEDLFEQIQQMSQINDINIKIPLYNLVAILQPEVRELYIDIFDENGYLQNASQQDQDQWVNFYQDYENAIKDQFNSYTKQFQQIQIHIDTYQDQILYQIICNVIPNNVLQSFIQTSQTLQIILNAGAKQLSQHEINKEQNKILKREKQIRK